MRIKVNINILWSFATSLLFLNNQILVMEEIGALSKLKTPMKIKFSKSEQKPQEQKEQEQKPKKEKNKEFFLNQYAEFQKKWEGVSLSQWAKIQQTFYPKTSNEWQILQEIIEEFKNKDYYKKKYMNIIEKLGEDPVIWARKYKQYEDPHSSQYAALEDIIYEYEDQPRKKPKKEEEGAPGVIPTPSGSSSSSLTEEFIEESSSQEPIQLETISEQPQLPQQSIMQRWFPNAYQYWQRSAAAVSPYVSSAQQKLKDLYNQYQTKIKQGVGIGAAAVGGLGALYWWKYGRGASNQ